MQEVLEDIEASPLSNFTLLPDCLHIKLQVGSKVKDCVFEMKTKEFSFLEEIEYLLWVTSEEKGEVEQSKADIG